MDHYIGVFIERLKDLGLYDDALIVLISDHGHPLSDHGKFLKGGDRLYNELLKVPFTIHFPGGRYAGQRLDALSSFHDVLPTLLDAIGLGNNLDALPGKSLMPVIRGEAEAIRDVIISGYYGAPDRVIRDKVWSYIRRPDDEPDELYNLVEDPAESHNLIDDQPKEAQRLAASFGVLYALKGAPVKVIQGKYGWSTPRRVKGAGRAVEHGAPDGPGLERLSARSMCARCPYRLNRRLANADP